jgi:hypothetical protein
MRLLRQILCDVLHWHRVPGKRLDGVLYICHRCGRFSA